MVRIEGDIKFPLPTDVNAYSGIIRDVTIDTNATGIGALLYLASDGNYDEADASAVAQMPAVALAVESGTGSKKVLIYGYLKKSTWARTPGQILYVSPTTGTITATAPNSTGEQVQRIGYAISSTVIFFNPSLDVIEHA